MGEETPAKTLSKFYEFSLFMTASSSEYVIPRLYQNICFVVLVLLVVPHVEESIPNQLSHRQAHISETKILRKFLKTQLMSYSVNHQTPTQTPLMPNNLGSLFLKSCSTPRFLACVPFCTFPSSHSRNAVFLHSVFISQQLPNIYLHNYLFQWPNALEWHPTEPDCSRGLREQGKELRKQVLAQSDIKLHSKFPLLRVLLSNFTFPPKTEAQSLSLFSPIPLPQSQSFGVTRHITQLYY